MANTVEKLNIEITAEDKGIGVLKNAKLAVAGLGVAVGALALKMGKEAVVAAANFEKQMTNVQTLFGDNTKAVDKLSDGIKEMLTRVPTNADDLGAAAYSVVSAGISDAADALVVLEESAKLGVAGLGTTAEAVDVMTSAINAFNLPAEEANQVADVFFKTVKAGKTDIAAIAQGFGGVAPIASSMSVSFKELSAATAAVTTTGLSASEVQTGLKATMSSLIKPTKELQEIYQILGVESGQQLIESQGGLVNALNAVKTAGEAQNVQFGALIGSVEGLGVAESLLGAQNEAFTQTLADMTTGSNAVDLAFKQQTATAHAQWQVLKNNLQVVLINIGQAILPVLIEAMGILSGWFETNQENIKLLAQLMGGALKIAFEAVRTTVRAMSDSLNLLVDIIEKVINGFKRATQAARAFFERGKVDISAGGVTGRFDSRAAGGPLSVNRPTLVGEMGPELILPKTGGTVIPNHALGGGSGTVVNFTFAGPVSSREVAEEYADIMIDQLKLSTAIS